MVRIWGRINYFRICRQTDRAFQIKSEGKAYPFLLTILKPCGFQTFHCMTVLCELFEGLYSPVSDLKRGLQP